MARTVFVDWGTTNFRAYLVDPRGTVLASRSSGDGVKTSAGRHAEILRSHIQDWLDEGDLDAVACAGTIGSELGWQDVAMVPAPAGLGDVARGLHALSVPAFPPVWIIPGVCQRDDPDRPGMMRGEEVILFGCLAVRGVESGLFCFPGTHSKWVTVEGGRVRDIQTVMTGECFELLRSGSVLARSLSGWSGEIAEAWFARGVDMASDVANPLQSAFFVRALHVQGRLPTPQARASLLSGLLIGAEIKGMAAGRAPGSGPVTIVAATALGGLYAQACHAFGVETVAMDDDACFVAGARAVMRTHETFAAPVAPLLA